MARRTVVSNPTGLVSISRDDVALDFDMSSKPGSVSLTKLDLTNYKFQLDDLVLLVGLSGSARKRFALGTVGAFDSSPQSLLGLDFDQLKFRLLIRKVDSKIFVGSAEELKPLRAGDSESLFPIVPADLGQQLWKLELSERNIELLINQSVFPNAELVKNYAPFTSLVVPEVARQIFAYLSSQPELAESAGSVWSTVSKWVEDCGLTPPPSEHDEHESPLWVEEATSTYCSRLKFADELKSTINGGEK